MTHREFRARIRALRSTPHHERSDDNIEAQAQEPLMESADEGPIDLTAGQLSVLYFYSQNTTHCCFKVFFQRSDATKLS